MDKPLCLVLEEAEQLIERAILETKLPCYLLTPIVESVLHRLENGKRTEIENAKKSLEATNQEEK